MLASLALIVTKKETRKSRQNFDGFPPGYYFVRSIWYEIWIRVSNVKQTLIDSARKLETLQLIQNSDLQVTIRDGITLIWDLNDDTEEAQEEKTNF